MKDSEWAVNRDMEDPASNKLNRGQPELQGWDRRDELGLVDDYKDAVIRFDRNEIHRCVQWIGL